MHWGRFDQDRIGVWRYIAEEEIVCLARRVGKSTTTRAWLGALIGATASLPFGISMVGDMIMPAAIGGALVARNTATRKHECFSTEARLRPASRFVQVRFASLVD